MVIHEIQELTEGKNNQNFKILTGQGNYFLKIGNTSDTQRLNRQTEFFILEKVYSAGMGVKPLFCDPLKGIIITEFLDYPAWLLEEISKPEVLEKFAKAIYKIHQLPPINQTSHIADFLDRLWQSLENSPGINDLKLFFKSTRKKIDAFHQSDDIRFCHSDLCHGHFLKSKTIIFLDWELAGMNDIYSDLATFVHFQKLNNEQTELFLQSYSQKTLNKKKLATHLDAILIRELLWVLSKLQEGHTDSFYTDYRQRCLNAVMEKL